MALSETERQAIIKATSDYIVLKERGELLQEQQGGRIQSFPSDLADRVNRVHLALIGLIAGIQRTRGKTAIKCRGITFALNYNENQEIRGLTIIPDDHVEVVDG